MTEKVLFIGLNPTKAKYRKGCAWYRLHDWIEDMGIDIFAFTNLSFDPWWDGKMNDDLYQIVSKSVEGHKVVALGGKVSKVLNRLNVDHFMLPHPSPLNRQINDTVYISDQLKKCLEYIG